MDRHNAPAWTEDRWKALLTSVRAELPDTIADLGATSAALLAEVRTLETRLEATSAPKFATAVTDVRYQLEALIYPGFLTGIGAHNLPNVVRYVEAMNRRMERLPEAPDKDAAAMAKVHALEHEHNRLGDLVGWTPEVEDIAWQLQELRVSLFAQAVGARGQVSEKRVRTALAQLDSGLH
jgi:ATP-dependent helicase HrpA